jgi:antitoxin component YwqK of YwqJK toxin-antitoxin module
VNTTASAAHKHRARLMRRYLTNRVGRGLRAMLALLCIFSLAASACTRDTGAIASYYRNRDGRVDEWQYRLDDGTIKIAIDTTGRGQPDLIRTYRNGELVKLERDRNLDGQTDWVEEYDHGKLTRLTRDDNFDGKPEIIDTYRHGKLVLAEYDLDACGSVDRTDYYTDYYDDSGKLIRTELRKR